jgi:hypothetical protein
MLPRSPSHPTACALLIALLAAPGCTATLAMLRVTETGRAVAEAEEAGASVNAAFEYQLALRHYQQAMEEHGDAQYRTSVDLAKIGMTWAEQAKIVATGGTRDINALQGGDDLSDESGNLNGPGKKPSGEGGELEDEDFLEEEDK